MDKLKHQGQVLRKGDKQFIVTYLTYHKVINILIHLKSVITLVTNTCNIIYTIMELGYPTPFIFGRGGLGGKPFCLWSGFTLLLTFLEGGV